jgi:nucleoside-diphosphate-sugar epimerase
MRILITDVTGELGRAAARSLLAAGHDVSGIAEHGSRYLEPDVDFVCAPLRHQIVGDLADEADAVLHLAPVEPDIPGSAGLNGVIHVTNAAARAGARVLFCSQAAGDPELYRQAEELVSTSWAPSLIIRMAPPVGRQTDWMVCRTVASVLGEGIVRPLRVLHIEDLLRFLVTAVSSDRTGVVDLATTDTTNIVSARRAVQRAEPRPRANGIPCWPVLTPVLDIAALASDWEFKCGWSAIDALTDTARGLAGRKLQPHGATDVSGRLPLPLEAVPRGIPADDTPLESAAAEALEGEFDDRIDPRFPVFTATKVAQPLPGPLTPMSLDVHLSGCRTANRVLAQLLSLHGVVGDECESRSIAVFGHRVFVGASAGAILAAHLPGPGAARVAAEMVSDPAAGVDLFPLGRPATPRGVLKPAAAAAVMARLLATARHFNAEVDTYGAAATAEHLDTAALTFLHDAQLDVRIRLLRDRVHQGWTLTAIGVLLDGAGAAKLERAWRTKVVADLRRGAPTRGGSILSQTAALVDALDADPELHALTEAGERAPARDALMRFTHELRTTLLELGRRRAAGELISAVDDVFYLTCDEALAMPVDTRLRIKRRRAERDRLQALQVPDVVDHHWAPMDFTESTAMGDQPEPCGAELTPRAQA